MRTGLFAPGRFSVRAALLRPLRVASERPRASAALAASDFIVLFIVSVTMVVIGAPIAQVAVSEDLLKFAEVLNAFIIYYVIVLIWGLVSETAWFRVMSRREPHILPPYRLWADEGRAFLIYMLLLVAMVVVIYGVAVLAVLTPSFFWPDGSYPDWAMALGLCLVFLGLIALQIVAMRLTVGVPVTVMERGLRPFAGWRATRGNVLRFVAAHVLACVTYIILLSLVAGLAFLAVVQFPNNIVLALVPLIAIYCALMTAFYAVYRGVNAEAAMVFLARQGAASLRTVKPPTPPASPASPGRGPGAVSGSGRSSWLPRRPPPPACRTRRFRRRRSRLRGRDR